MTKSNSYLLAVCPQANSSPIGIPKTLDPDALRNQRIKQPPVTCYRLYPQPLHFHRHKQRYLQSFSQDPKNPQPTLKMQLPAVLFQDPKTGLRCVCVECKCFWCCPVLMSMEFLKIREDSSKRWEKGFHTYKSFLISQRPLNSWLLGVSYQSLVPYHISLYK